MPELSEYDRPFSDMEKRVMSWVAEALELRHGAAGDPKGPLADAPESSPAEMTELLFRVRQRSDRVDELLANATRAKYRAKRAKEGAAFAYERRLNEATKKHSDRRQDFSAGFERAAEAKLDSFAERRVEYEADKLVSVTSEAHEVITQVHWQLDAMRKDLRGALHALQFESSLER